jgi:hypothetical protein
MRTTGRAGLAQAGPQPGLGKGNGIFFPLTPSKESLYKAKRVVYTGFGASGLSRSRLASLRIGTHSHEN